MLRTLLLLPTYNPFDGITPSFGPFQTLLNSKVGMLLALVWALGFVWCAFNLIRGLAMLSNGRRVGVSDAVEEGKATTLWAGGATIALASVAAIYAALVA